MTDGKCPIIHKSLGDIYCYGQKDNPKCKTCALFTLDAYGLPIWA